MCLVAPCILGQPSSHLLGLSRNSTSLRATRVALSDTAFANHCSTRRMFILSRQTRPLPLPGRRSNLDMKWYPHKTASRRPPKMQTSQISPFRQRNRLYSAFGIELISDGRVPLADTLATAVARSISPGLPTEKIDSNFPWKDQVTVASQCRKWTVGMTP